MIQTLSDALAARGYETLTPVQQEVSNPELAQSDLLVSAQTGSGKTVGFGLAIAPTLLGEETHFGPAAAPLALIIAPTRELAFQVMRELAWLYAGAGVRMASCVGGMDMRDERRALDRGAHIVVGTPGRLRDHIQRGSLDMTSLRAVVLDEADEMLDLGFREDLEFMLAEAPQDRRTLMFSATVPAMIATLAKKYQRDAVRVTTLSGGSQHADISYQAVQVAQQDCEHAVINLLRYHDAQNAIVFANTRAAVNRLTARFSNRGFSVVALSGELSQSERTHALQAMRDGRARVCVATDVAARGIDLPNLELVIHAELPTNAEGLLHRSGRTGRAGRKGISALIVPPKISKKAERLLKFAKIQAEWVKPPSPDDILKRDQERLLSDPVWTEEATETETAFAAQLLALHTPEQIAAAYLRLFQSRQSAPEELADPGARAPAKERKPFGPSTWFALSVGQKDRAEARWILPLLCRAGNLDKDAIGAIRVSDAESFVELQQNAVPGFLKSIGDAGKLEDGVTIRQLDSAPDLGSLPRPSAKPRPEHRSAAKPAAARPHTPKPQTATPYSDTPLSDTPSDAGPAGFKAPRKSKGKPAEKAPYKAPAAAKPRKPRQPDALERAVTDGAVKPRHKAGEKLFKPKGKPTHAGKPAHAGKPSTKKVWDKPAAAASDTKPADTPKKGWAKAADSSKRFTPPGKPGKPSKPGKPGNKKTKGSASKSRAGFGGNAPPKRSKS
ncbi:DEAD/DEAH box helicase [Roseovarius litorisediminis]|nr:DEAD/DEAH box helicase [Roseovarius litorisediminis]